MKAIDWEIGFLECSAKNNENIFRIFKELLNQKQTQTIRKSIEERNERIINSQIFKPKVSLKPNNCTIS
jgi:GTPase SAR1 family protein